MSETLIEPYIDTRRAMPPDGEWFLGAGFGIFIHWDQASQQGLEISWPLAGVSFDVSKGGEGTYAGTDDPERTITVDQYQSTAAAFNPVRWDAKELAELIKRSGASYAVFTTRHHAGYNMFHTQYSTFGIERSSFHRDVTREFVEAVRAADLKVGLYYSLPDWNHPDYPAMTDIDRPYPFGDPSSHRRATPRQWNRYRGYLRGQVTELLTNYGDIDLMWFDLHQERTAEEWGAAEMRALIRTLQPNVLVNDRLPGQGDYSTPEQAFPLEQPEGRWELCQTIGGQWGWGPNDKLRAPRELIRTLIETASRGGNYLLNIGPKGDGSIDCRQVDVLDAIGQWMQQHRESVVGVSPTSGVQFYGPMTTRPGRIYLHLVMQPVDDFVVRNLPTHRVESVRLLATGDDLAFRVVPGVFPESPSGEAMGEIVITAPEPSGAIVDVIAIDFRTTE